MKVTWKNTKKKRCLPHLTDLPFEHNQQEDQSNSNPNNDTEEYSDGVVRAPNSHQLAKEFQAQGDNLAMVYTFPFYLLVFK